MTPQPQIGGFRLDRVNQCVWRGAERVELSPKAFAVLAFLADRAGRLVTKQELLDAVWPDIHVTEGVLKRAILEVRKALGDDAEEPRYIQTLHRRGYRFLPDAAPPVPEAEPPSPAPGRSRIAVLPFVNMSSDVENEYFSDGLTEELINRLASIPGLQVVARTSAFRFKGRNEDLREVGRTLNVGTVLEGSVRWADGQIRMTAQLIDVESGYHLLSKTYQREYRGIFELQDALACAVVDEIAPQTGVPAAAVQTHTDNLDAYRAYLRGMFVLGGRFLDLGNALTCFREALGLAPDYAPAWAGLAQGYFLLAWFYKMRPEDALPLAREAALRTLAIDPESALGLSSLAAIECAADWDWQAAERRFQRALDVQPGLAIAYVQYCFCCLLPQQRFDEACSILQRGLAIDPLNPLLHACAIDFYGRAGRYEDAMRQYDVALTIGPEYAPISAAAGLTHEWAGRLDAAVAEYRRTCALSKDAPFPLSCLGHALAMKGETAEARRIAAQLEQSGVSESEVARVYLGLRDAEQAVRWLERAAERRSLYLLRVTGDPRFDWLFPSPRFQAILRAMGLPVARAGVR